jgi:hypothetical protein
MGYSAAMAGAGVWMRVHSAMVLLARLIELVW